MTKLKKFLSYAQEYEDLIIYHALKDVENGFYVDVGANDPWDLSVTKYLYELGWSGINVEPLSDKYHELVLDRPRDVNCCMGAGSEDGEIVFYSQGTGSTCDEQIAKKAGSINNKTIIPVKKLANIISENIPDPKQEIHFCKIDVEGFERSVLEGLDFDIYRPWVFIMESTLPGTSIPCFSDWEHILINAGYIFVMQYGISRYYLDNRYEALKNNFLSPDSLKKIYNVYELSERDFKKYYRIGIRVTSPMRLILRLMRAIKRKIKRITHA